MIKNQILPASQGLAVRQGIFFISIFKYITRRKIFVVNEISKYQTTVDPRRNLEFVQNVYNSLTNTKYLIQVRRKRGGKNLDRGDTSEVGCIASLSPTNQSL